MSDRTYSGKQLHKEFVRAHDRLTSGRTADIFAIFTLIVFVIVIRPIVASDFMLGYSLIVNTILVWMLFAAAYNLLLGYTGLLSFGHAMFLGWGIYSIAIVLSQFSTSLFFLAAIIAIVGATVLGYIVARLIVQKDDIYFAMLTIAFGQVLWYVANANPANLTGGTNGLAENVLPPWIVSEIGQKYLLLGGSRIEFYWVIAIVFVICIYLLFRIVRSPFGRTLIAIRENEELARSIGVNTTRYKVYAFTLSAMFTSIAGILLEIVNQGATLTSLHWRTSGEVVMMTVLGGTSSFVGPMVGAFIWQFGESFLTTFQVLQLPLSEFTLVSYDIGHLLEYWQFLFGLLFVLVVLSRPESGAWGVLKNTVNWFGERLSSGGEEQ